MEPIINTYSNPHRIPGSNGLQQNLTKTHSEKFLQTKEKMHSLLKQQMGGGSNTTSKPRAQTNPLPKPLDEKKITLTPIPNVVETKSPIDTTTPQPTQQVNIFNFINPFFVYRYFMGGEAKKEEPTHKNFISPPSALKPVPAKPKPDSVVDELSDKFKRVNKKAPSSASIMATLKNMASIGSMTSLKNFLNPPVYDKENETTITYILKEIVDTEERYNNHLSFLLASKPKFEAKPEILDFLLDENIQTEIKKSIKNIFEEAEKIKKTSDSLRNQFFNMSVCAGSITQLAKNLNTLPLEVYDNIAPRSKEYLTLKKTLPEHSQKRLDWKLKQLMNNDQHLDFEALFSTMLQRLPRYILLVDELCKNISTHNSVHQNLIGFRTNLDNQIQKMI